MSGNEYGGWQIGLVGEDGAELRQQWVLSRSLIRKFVSNNQRTNSCYYGQSGAGGSGGSSDFSANLIYAVMLAVKLAVMVGMSRSPTPEQQLKERWSVSQRVVLAVVVVQPGLAMESLPLVARAGGGNGGEITVQPGMVTTENDDSIGIMAQSIGGSGGSGSNTGGIVALGGTGGNGGTTGTVTINTGDVTTSGKNSAALFAESIGGGGGKGGNSGVYSSWWISGGGGAGTPSL